MRITTDSIDKFLECLEHEDDVFCNTIRVNSAEKAFANSAVKFQVAIQASAIVRVGEDAEYLLEGGEICGVDYRDKTQDLGGTKRMQMLKAKIADFAKAKNWKVLPGIIEL